MHHFATGGLLPEDMPCRYGRSRLMFRGPRQDFSRPYVAFLGGAETQGRFVTAPFPTLLQAGLGVACANLGVAHAGIDTVLLDPELPGIVAGSRLTVLQVSPAYALSNRLYRVHPRRNDRFLEPSTMLRALYPEVDFTEFSFNRHLLDTLARVAPARFRIVLDELRQAWLARMRLFLDRTEGPVVLLWLRADPTAGGAARSLGAEPLFVTRDMLAALRGLGADLVECAVRPASATGELDDMRAPPSHRSAAAHLPGPQTHRAIAAALLPLLQAALA